jgi:DNA polymerase-3 subunit delta'
MIHDSLDLLKTWIRDLAVVDQIPGQVVNQDCLERLLRVSRGIDPKKLNSLWQIVEKTQKAIAANANVRLTLDNMALSMRSLYRL